MVPVLSLAPSGDLVAPVRTEAPEPKGTTADRAEAADTAEAAERYAGAAADEICLRAVGVPAETAAAAVRRVAARVRIPLLVRTDLDDLEAIEGLISAGASRIAVRDQALRDPDRIASFVESFGSEAISVVILAEREGDHWRVFAGADDHATEWDAVNWARVVESQGGGEVIVRSVGGPGEPTDYDLDLLGALTRILHIPVLAAGEPDGPDPVFDALMVGDADGVLIDELFRSGTMTPRTLKGWLAEHGLSVRSG